MIRVRRSTGLPWSVLRRVTRGQLLGLEVISGHFEAVDELRLACAAADAFGGKAAKDHVKSLHRRIDALGELRDARNPAVKARKKRRHDLEKASLAAYLGRPRGT